MLTSWWWRHHHVRGRWPVRGEMGSKLGVWHPWRRLAGYEGWWYGSAHAHASFGSCFPGSISGTIRNRLSQLLHQRQVLYRLGECVGMVEEYVCVREKKEKINFVLKPTYTCKRWSPSPTRIILIWSLVDTRLAIYHRIQPRTHLTVHLLFVNRVHGVRRKS